MVCDRVLVSKNKYKMSHTIGPNIAERDKIAPLTSLRFFAAFFVVFYHLQGDVIPMASRSQFALGVSFFFVLSGFILSTVYPDMSRTSIPKFYVSRLARLWPVHALCFFVVAFLYDPSMLFNEFWQPKLFTNLAMLHAWIPQMGYVFSMNSVSWSISAELGFYLIFPILAASRSPGKVAIVIGTLVAIGIFQLEFNGATMWNNDPWQFSGVLLIAQSPFARVFEFAVGVWAARVYQSRKFVAFVTANATRLECLSIVILFLYCMASRRIVNWLIADQHHGFAAWVDVSGGVLVFAFLIYVFAHSAGKLSRILSTRALIFLGESSFSLYMVHQIIIKYSVNHGWHKILPWPATLMIMLSAIMLTAAIVYVAWERPMRWLIMKAYGIAASQTNVAIRGTIVPSR